MLRTLLRFAANVLGRLLRLALAARRSNAERRSDFLEPCGGGKLPDVRELALPDARELARADWAGSERAACTLARADTAAATSDMRATAGGA